MTVMLPEWDGSVAVSGLLPPWAAELTRTCTTHTFTTCEVYEGRAVLARRVAGTGPLLVITPSEDEMREALGLQPRKA